MAVFKFLLSSKLISHKMRVAEKFWNITLWIHAIWNNILLEVWKVFPQMLALIILIHLSLDNVISITDGQRLLLLAKLNWDRRALNTIWLSPYGLEGLFRNYHNANSIAFYSFVVQTKYLFEFSVKYINYTIQTHLLEEIILICR